MNNFPSPYGNYLPIFPCLGFNAECLVNFAAPWGPVTEERIERVVERLVNRADRDLMNGAATQEQYDLWVQALKHWAEEQYASITSAAD